MANWGEVVAINSLFIAVALSIGIDKITAMPRKYY